MAEQPELDQSYEQPELDQSYEQPELDQSYDEHDVSEMPESSQPDGDDVQPDTYSPVEEEEETNDMAREGDENKDISLGGVENKDTSVGGVENRWPGWPGESVFRILAPSQKVGGIIGRKGELIKKMCEETKARIKILDGPPGIPERAVLVSAKEEPDASLPPAVDALLKVLKRTVDGLDSDSSHAPPVMGGKVSARLMAPAAQAGSLIGKQGTTVKSIQEASSCIVRVLGAEDLPPFALQDDRIIEVLGEPLGVLKAVELIASHLRRFLVDRSVVPMFEMQMQMPNPQMEQQHMPPPQSWGPPHQGFPPSAGGGPGYGGNHHYALPPRQVDNYYPPAEMPPPMEKQPHHGISAYGREAPASMHAPSNAQPAPSIVTQVTHQMQVPLSYADAVIGTGGSSISYIRRASGATVAIQETRGVPGEMTVEISGTASQVQTAEQLIQNSMAEAAAAAAASTQAQTGAPPADQGYNPYAAPQTVYASPPSSTDQTGGYAQTGGYGHAVAAQAGGYSQAAGSQAAGSQAGGYGQAAGAQTGGYGQAAGAQTGGYGQAGGAYGSVYGANYGY